jgi:hypothetical protein
MSDQVVYRPYFFYSQAWQASSPVSWWVDEGTPVTFEGQEMVRFHDTLVPAKRGDWFATREEALKHVAEEVRRYAAMLAEKAEEIES